MKKTKSNKNFYTTSDYIVIGGLILFFLAFLFGVGVLVCGILQNDIDSIWPGALIVFCCLVFFALMLYVKKTNKVREKALWGDLDDISFDDEDEAEEEEEESPSAEDGSAPPLREAKYPTRAPGSNNVDKLHTQLAGILTFCLIYGWPLVLWFFVRERALLIVAVIFLSLLTIHFIIFKPFKLLFRILRVRILRNRGRKVRAVITESAPGRTPTIIPTALDRFCFTCEAEGRSYEFEAYSHAPEEQIGLSVPLYISEKDPSKFFVDKSNIL